MDRAHFVKAGPRGIMLSKLAQLVRMVEARNRELSALRDEARSWRATSRARYREILRLQARLLEVTRSGPDEAEGEDTLLCSSR